MKVLKQRWVDVVAAFMLGCVLGAACFARAIEKGWGDSVIAASGVAATAAAAIVAIWVAWSATNERMREQREMALLVAARNSVTLARFARLARDVSTSLGRGHFAPDDFARQVDRLKALRPVPPISDETLRLLLPLGDCAQQIARATNQLENLKDFVENEVEDFHKRRGTTIPSDQEGVFGTRLSNELLPVAEAFEVAARACDQALKLKGDDV